jgi:hypothetical protein
MCKYPTPDQYGNCSRHYNYISRSARQTTPLTLVDVAVAAAQTRVPFFFLLPRPLPCIIYPEPTAKKILCALELDVPTRLETEPRFQHMQSMGFRATPICLMHVEIYPFFVPERFLKHRDEYKKKRRRKVISFPPPLLLSVSCAFSSFPPIRPSPPWQTPSYPRKKYPAMSKRRPKTAQKSCRD